MNTASPPRRSLLNVAMPENEDARVGPRSSEPSTLPHRASPRGNNERNARIVDHVPRGDAMDARATVVARGLDLAIGGRPSLDQN